MMWWNGANPAMAWVMAITMLVLMVVVVAIIIWAVVLGVRVVNGRFGPRGPLQVLEERYARGEISTEDYDERRRRLTAPASDSGTGTAP